MEPMNFTAVSDNHRMKISLMNLSNWRNQHLSLAYVLIDETEQANEDGNCYSFDGRKNEEAKCVHKDHVSAV